MSNSEHRNTLPTAPAASSSAKPGFWRRVKQTIVRSDKEFSFFKGLGIVSVLGTLIAGYFQYLSAYHDKVSAVAQQDMAAATSAFSEVSQALSIPLSLQERLVFGFYDAVNQKVDTDDDAYVTKNTRAINDKYETEYSALRENVNLLARKMEIYADWPSWRLRDLGAQDSPTADAINLSLLGAHDFACDKDDTMPFENGAAALPLRDPSGAMRKLTVDWNSAKHHVFTIVYCFESTHKQMKTVRQWAAKNSIDPASKEKFIKQFPALRKILDNQAVRLNIFMSVAMNELDRIRDKYRPTGFSCHLPIVREVVDLFPSHSCAPVLTR